MSENLQEAQAKFRRAADKPVLMYPAAPEQFERLEPEVALSQVLIEEEYQELIEALDRVSAFKEDPQLYYQLLSEVCREGVDLIYVILDLFNSLGLPAGAMFREIHRANMSKVGEDGKIKRREDGKIEKPDDFKSADPYLVIMEARDYKE